MVGPGSVSVVATVLNEAGNIDDWLDGLLGQSRLPDELVIVDGGSSDDTVARIERRMDRSPFPVVVVSAPGANISQGRNIAIERATCDLIAVTDAGTIADREWLDRLIEPLLDERCDVASGFFVPRLETAWQRALASTTLPDAGEIVPDRFLPSSRSVAFRRQWFDVGVRYPEWLDYCEDLIWDLSMQRAGARFVFVPDATVTFDVRPTPSAFVRQYYRYARGDGKAGLFAKRHVARYSTYLLLTITLARRRPVELFIAGVLGVGYIRTPIHRLIARDRRLGRRLAESITLIPLVAALRAIGDLAKMAGYPVGLIWRWKRFGGVGWRTTWRRISPAGTLFHPATSTRESQLPPVSPGGESHGERR